MSKKEELGSTFEQENVDREHVHETAHEIAPPIELVRTGPTVVEKEEEHVSDEKKFSHILDFDEFEDDEEEEGIEHPENHHRFPLERKFIFYFGLALLVVPVLIVTPTPFPSWLLFPIISPIALFFMALGVGKEHAKWHIKSVPRKIRIGLKNFIRGIFG